MIVISSKSINPANCPFFIFAGDHYRVDGSCKCNDRAERARLIRESGYTKRDFKNILLLKGQRA